jgi:hypothetical protein
MARVPITIMGYRCDRCGYEWLPKRRDAPEPRTCASLKCKSPYWNRPRRNASPMLTYEDFAEKIRRVLAKTEAPTTWTELRTAAKLPQALPNNKWVRRLEKDIGLKRARDDHGIIRWSIQ